MSVSADGLGRERYNSAMTSNASDHTTAQTGRRPRPWTWNDVNFLLDGLLLAVFAALCFAAVVVRFVFPPGPSAKGWMLWGLDYDAWGGIQFGLLALLAGGILVHVMFHWSWVCTVLVTRFLGGKQRIDEGLQTIYGVGLLIVLLNIVGGAVAAAVLTIKGPT
ncbi:MAG: DUF4405 domain-containing protein [Planctomycetia bacterium]